MALKTLTISSPRNNAVFGKEEKIRFAATAMADPAQALYYRWYSSLHDRGESLNQPVQATEQPQPWEKDELPVGAQNITLAATDQPGDDARSYSQVKVGGVTKCLVHVIHTEISSVHQLPGTQAAYQLEVGFALPRNWLGDKPPAGSQPRRPEEYANWQFNFYLSGQDSPGPPDELLPRLPDLPATVWRDRRLHALFHTTSMKTGRCKLTVRVSVQGEQHKPAEHTVLVSLLSAASLKEKRDAQSI